MHWCINPPWSECIVHSKIHLHTSIPWVPQVLNRNLYPSIYATDHTVHWTSTVLAVGMAHTSAPLPHPFPTTTPIFYFQTTKRPLLLLRVPFIQTGRCVVREYVNRSCSSAKLLYSIHFTITLMGISCMLKYSKKIFHRAIPWFESVDSNEYQHFRMILIMSAGTDTKCNVLDYSILPCYICIIFIVVVIYYCYVIIAFIIIIVVVGWIFVLFCCLLLFCCPLIHYPYLLLTYFIQFIILLFYYNN